MTDTQLQQRAGKNYPNFLLFHLLSESLKRIESKTFVLLENVNDEALMISFFTNDIFLINKSADPIDATLFIEDADGNRVPLDSNTIGSGVFDSFNTRIAYLNRGEKLVFEITSPDPITSGEGVWAIMSTNVPAAPVGSAENHKHTRVTSTTYELTKRHGSIPGGGGVGVGLLLTVLNFSITDLFCDVIASTPQGDLTLLSGFPIDNTAVNEITGLPPITPSEAVTIRLVFSGVPADKYLLVCEEYLVPINRYDQPIP